MILSVQLAVMNLIQGPPFCLRAIFKEGIRDNPGKWLKFTHKFHRRKQNLPLTCQKLIFNPTTVPKSVNIQPFLLVDLLATACYTNFHFHWTLQYSNSRTCWLADLAGPAGYMDFSFHAVNCKLRELSQFDSKEFKLALSHRIFKE